MSLSLVLLKVIQHHWNHQIMHTIELYEIFYILVYLSVIIQNAYLFQCIITSGVIVKIFSVNMLRT